MQGTELALLLGICMFALALSLYRRDFGIIFIVLVFGDYVAIQGKILFGYQFLGGYKELALALVCLTLLIPAQDRFLAITRNVFLLGVALVTMMLSPDYRPFSALIIAAVAGTLIASWHGKVKPNIPLLTLLSLVLCAYQFVYIKAMADLWFFDFMAEKAGEEFTTNIFAFFRNERVRPPGFLVSPSLFGFVFILFSYLIEKSEVSRVMRYLTKLGCFAALAMIQTRALLIVFLAYEFQKMVFPNLKPRTILAYYFFLLIATLAMTIFYGDEGALVRILLFTSLLSDLSSGIGLLPLGAGYNGPVDSQFVAFVRLFGLPGILAAWWYIRAIYRQSKVPQYGSTAELSFVCVILFINIFQWSGSSPGNLLAWMLLAFYVRKNNMWLESSNLSVATVMAPT